MHRIIIAAAIALTLAGCSTATTTEERVIAKRYKRPIQRTS
jgi:hypothetical protein